jgi:hypothetical protein
MRCDTQLGGLTDRANLEAKHWAAPHFKWQARIESDRNQPVAQSQHRRCCAHSNPERRACVGADQLNANYGLMLDLDASCEIGK